MNLESLPKYFSPKGIMFSDSPSATATDSFSITDVMASLGLASAKARLGIELFLAKQGINSIDEAVESLYQYAMTQVHKHSAINKLDEDVKQNVLQLLANYAFQDYARSAASKKVCPDCDGGFITVRKFTTKYGSSEGMLAKALNMKPKRFITSIREVEERCRVLCKTCKGKGSVSHSCRCNGRGQVLDEKQTKLQGVPIYKACLKCSGRGYSRLKFTEVFEAIKPLTGISKTTCYDKYQPLFEQLVSECFKEEEQADCVLSKLTKREFISF
ncbi:antitermination protein [Photorhabdus laumondii subsp. laumondii]|uniref:Photorhabdus luminescens subsp. laumondii TTO1 complete genome segment 10/17 n=2 Tax=Photorhabdus laumondii subsp. laumondii TaxID=141679 RepID=Q7N312_PHOLL|nr:antitermination protein [Photorhabdus laumondii]AWK42618.1 antitermination protein [Photorhabdus laumondii subsp. laumondii]AXG47943.1 antitermination protein [Photorhabdus laumondii subsp. laumondii]MCC8384599.1 antitermination protein [Photorhabdus laumondii]MCC8413355.1 antitermination protein [Photorhabdus laumondii]NDK95020.1 antitermination protein [Photorhabdus laumondii subsp. laumondii]